MNPPLDWTLCPYFWARGTGFPLDAVLGLRFGTTVQTLDRAVNAQLRAEQLTGQLTSYVTAHSRVPPKPAPMPKIHPTRIVKLLETGKEIPETTIDVFEPEHAAAWLALLKQWNEAQREWAENLKAAAEQLPAELMERRAGLRAAFRDERVLEALWISSRQLAQNTERHFVGEPGPRGSKDRQVERTAFLFLQRLATKNETISFFGPYFWGRFNSEQTEAMVFSPGQGPAVKRNMVSFEHWAVYKLARVISAERSVWLELRPFLNSACRLEGGALIYPIARRIELDDQDAAMIQLADGTHTTRQLLEKLSTHPQFKGKPVEELERLFRGKAERRGGERLWREREEGIENFLRDFTDRRILTCELLIPTVIPNPEQALLAQVSALPDSCESKQQWVTAVGQLCDLVHRYRAAGYRDRQDIAAQMDALFESVTGGDAERGAGKMYAARTLVYEDCERNVEVLELGAPIQRLLQDLGPYFDLGRWITLELPRRYEARYVETFWQLSSQGPPRVDLIRFLSETGFISATTEIEAGLRAEVAQAWREVLGERFGQNVEEVAITAEDCRQVLALLRQRSPADSDLEVTSGSYHSPDFLIAAKDVDAINRGEFQLVLGEMHKATFMVVQPVAQPFCPYREQLDGFVLEHLRKKIYQLVDRADTHTRADANWPDLPPFHEILPDAAAPRFPSDRVVRLGDLDVVEDDGHLYLETTDGKVREWYFSAIIDGSFLRKPQSTDPVHLSEDAHPRVVYGDKTVLMRRKWTFHGPPVPNAGPPPKPDSVEPWAALRAWQKRHGLPDLCFFKIPTEPKPVFMDFTNYLAVELFLKLTSDATSFVMSEMLPGPGDLWLSDADGRRYTSEIRTTVVHASSR